MAAKVLVVSSYKDTWNAVRPEGEMLIGLHRQGVDIQVMTQGDADFAARFREAGIRVIDFHPRKKFDREAVRRIRAELTGQDRQILHLFNNKAIRNGIAAARGLPVKVVTYRGYTGNIHWWNPVSYLTHLSPRVDKITCVSDAVKESFERQLFFPKGKAVTVSKGHDPAWYADIQPAGLSEFSLPGNAVAVAVVANARRMKGIPFLIEATHRIPPGLPVYFLMIGRGLEGGKTGQLVARSPLRDRFIFTGFRSDVLSLVSACDISLLPSVKGEGLSKVLLESMFLGVPAIMTNIGGNRGLAIHGETALVVPACNPDALAEAVILLAENPELRREMGPKGRAFVRSHFGIDRSVAEMKAVYESLVGG